METPPLVDWDEVPDIKAPEGSLTVGGSALTDTTMSTNISNIIYYILPQTTQQQLPLASEATTTTICGYAPIFFRYKCNLNKNNSRVIMYKKMQIFRLIDTHTHTRTNHVIITYHITHSQQHSHIFHVHHPQAPPLRRRAAQRDLLILFLSDYEQHYPEENQNKAG